jgi:hypothetical protein
MKKFWKYLSLSILALLLLSTLGFLVWASNPAQPEDRALNSMISNQAVQYEMINKWLVYTPQGSDPTTGLILYPGGRVDTRAYAPLASLIAHEGFAVIVVPMPLNFAFLGVNRATQVIETFPEIDHWAIGGHSLGGAMAAEFAKSNLNRIDGLVLWASYPAQNTDLSETNLAVASIYASNDGLATLQDIQDSKARLPEDTQFLLIEGGNHAGFGWYGSQNGDGDPEITRVEQQDQIVAGTINLLRSLGQ